MNIYATNIAIGGVLQTSRLPELLAAASLCGTAFDWNGDRLQGTDADLACLRDMIDEARKAGEPLRLYNDSASWGRFDEIETFCRSVGLAYRRESDPDQGETGTVCWWMSGMAEPTERPADSDGEPFVYVRDIVAVLDGARTQKAAVAAMRDIAKRATPFDVTVLTLRDS